MKVVLRKRNLFRIPAKKNDKKYILICRVNEKTIFKLNYGTEK
jgi:hypothetical protein